MAYIGKQPEFTQYPSKFFDGDGSAMTVTLDYAPPNDAALLVFISGVRQDTSAYNCTGTSLTFTGSVPSGTANVQVVHMGLTVDVGVPGDDTVTTVKIQDDAVTVAKLANSINTDIDANTAKTGITSGQATAITANTAKVTNATHTGDVTGATALTIAVDAVDIAMLSATGTADATTFLRGDNAWVATSSPALSHVSQWRLTTEVADSANPLTSNFAEVDTDGYTRIGSAMTESSGVFTFPATGIWKIEALFSVQIISNNSFAYGRGGIEVSTNTGGAWSLGAQSVGSGTDSSSSDESAANIYVSHQFDVTNTSTHLVRFQITQQVSTAYLLGNSAHTFTGFTFTKLGDT